MIICFTGTGNSLIVARSLQQHLGGEIVMLSHDLLRDPASQVLEVPEGESVIWLFPVYSWGIPPVVERFIRKSRIKLHCRTDHFLVATCGDDCGRTDDRWRDAISHRGWDPAGAFTVIMPNTYVCMQGFDVDDPETEARKLSAQRARTDEIAAKIKAGFRESDVERGKMAWMKTNLVYPMFKRFSMSPRPFHATAECTSCGLCARICPMGNISMTDATPQRPQWGNSCALCLRCYHRCPSHAVAYGKETEGKGQYISPVKLS